VESKINKSLTKATGNDAWWCLQAVQSTELHRHRQTLGMG